MLTESLHERKNNFNPPANNHMSTYALGSIVFVVAGFESWLNEAINHLSRNYDTNLRTVKIGKTNIGNCSPRDKLSHLCKWNGAGRIVVRDHLDSAIQSMEKNFDLIIEVRNEIVHPVPFGIGMPWNVPGDLLELHEKGILMTTGKHDAEYSFNDKIRSYALAYWSWEVIESAVALVVEHVETDQVIGWTAQNFSQYRSICPPKDLPGYDASQRN